MNGRLGSLSLWVAILSLSACATIPATDGDGVGRSPGSTASHADLRTREERALSALTREDFQSARRDLLWIASRCEAGEPRLRALLLLASSDLDPTNPKGSPRAAAVAAAAYLLSDSAPPDRLPLARSLFRLAADRGALDSDTRLDEAAAHVELAASCAEVVEEPLRRLPSVPTTSLARRIEALEADLSSRADSLAVVTDRVGLLEAELRRIATILRDDALPMAPSPRRP